jgi:hypothetical protein
VRGGRDKGDGEGDDDDGDDDGEGKGKSDMLMGNVQMNKGRSRLSSQILLALRAVLAFISRLQY